MADDYAAANQDDEHLEEGESLIKPLDEDYDTPFSAPTDTVDSGHLDTLHQATDNATDIDSQQLYDEGLSGAAEATEPNAKSLVEGYDPERDQRKHNPN